MPDPIAKLRALVGAAAVQLRDDLDATPRRPATALDRLAVLAPELLAVVETGEALQRLLPHICGNSPHYGAAHSAAKAHREALAALDAKLDEVTR